MLNKLDRMKVMEKFINLKGTNFILKEWKKMGTIPKCHDADQGNGGDLQCFVATDTIIMAATHVLVTLRAAAAPVAYR